MAGKDKLEYDIIANDKASTPMDKIARAGKDLGTGVSRGADKGADALKKLTAGAKDTEGALSKLGGAGKDGLGKLADGFKAGPLAFLGIGAGLGAAVLDGFGQAMEKQDAGALLTAQIGASNEESKKLGKISGDLYSNAFGESVGEVNDVLKTVFQSGLAAVGDAEDDIKAVTTQVMNYAKITGEEALPVTRAISQMLKTGLAKNATEAFDLLTRGVQKGLDKSEDLLDTVNEYGTQFRKVGLTGQQAFGLISQALQAGARDSDIAADAIKEFSIRAVDGSELSAQSFKTLGLNAKAMTAQFARGGPEAAKGLELVLDKLRGIKDPAVRSAAAVGLFGTQAEDLGDALYAMDLGTAAKEFGQVAGAAERAGDVINDTASNKLTTLKRSIQGSIVDAIGKYALPKLEQFADWFNGPGKMVIIQWALKAAQGMINFADGTLQAIGSVVGAIGKLSKVLMIGAAAQVAFFDPKLAYHLLKNADALDEWANGAQGGINKARESLQGWSDTLSRTETTVKLQADIEELDQKLAKAQRELRDPGLTKERKAKLNADIASLLRQKDTALRQLNDPGLIKTRTAQLDANKTSLDAKLAAARAALKDPNLTRERRATLNANIEKLLRQKRQAQAAIDALHGKTVPVTFVVKYKYQGGAPAGQPGSTDLGGLFPKREQGGPVRKGEAYIVGEKRPELFIPDQSGTVLPNTRGAEPSRTYMGGAGGGVLRLSFDDSEVGRFMLMMMRKAIANSGNGNNVQLALTGRAG